MGAPAPPPAPGGCTAKVTTQTWQSSSTTWSATVNVNVFAPSRAVPYYISLYSTAYIETTSAWNWYPAKTPTSGWITGLVKEAWQNMAGGPAQVGLIVSGRSSDLRPRAVSLAGTLCAVQYV